MSLFNRIRSSAGARKVFNSNPIASLTFASRPRARLPAQRPPLRQMTESLVPLGRVDIELFMGECPQAATNFLQLCTGELVLLEMDPTDSMHEEQFADTLKPQLHYLHSIMHRVSKGFMVQGGDIVNYDGTGQISAYGESFSAPDELSKVKFDRAGLVGTAVTSPSQNGSQFFVLTAEKGAPHLDGSCICFGRVVKGMDVVKKMEDFRVDFADRPATQDIVIASCGVN
eukprot:PhM_4_TR254/c0_g1_i1/m.52246